MLHFVIIISSFCIKLNYEIFVFCFTNIKGSDKLQFVGLIGGGRVLTWGRRVPASALPTWGSMPQVGNT